VAELNTVPRGIRPAELGIALDLPAPRLDVRRTHQWIAPDGARTEPLLLDESSHLHVTTFPRLLADASPSASSA
jgi:hypothetical protein